METNVTVGAWTEFSTKLTTDQLEVFKKAMGGLVGVNYTPLAAATQVVSGTNYRFVCNAKGAYPGSLNDLALVQIFKPFDGQAHVTSIKRCE